MKLLVIGAGGREHAIIRKLAESPLAEEIYCAPGNGGIACDAKCIALNAMDKEGIVAFAVQNGIDFAVVAPDDPLAAGMVDALEAAGIAAFGPAAKAAEIESSKVFSKNLMQKYGIPTAQYQVFTNPQAAIAYLQHNHSYPTVIKADGLALGKGVVIAQNFEQAKSAIQAIMEDKIFGQSGNQIVIEEYLTGPEVSVLAFTDGKTLKPMVCAKDHKRAKDHDEGLNTGGMGTVSPNPHYTPQHAKLCMETIFKPTVAAMNAEGRPFKGCLYFGLMLTPQGPKVIEYNCRFGDPETQVVLPRLQTDLLEIMLAVRNERLHEIEIEWSKEAAACVIMASGGYPEQYEKGKEITGLDENGQLPGVTVYHAGTKRENGKFYTNGGRVLGVTATGETLEQAIEKAYQGVSKIRFTGAHYRQDIGK